MKRIVSALALLAACAIPAALRGDSLIIAGGGFVGLWDTEIDLANTLAEPTDVSLSVRGLPLGAPCPPNCTGKTYRVPGHGTIRVLASDFIGELYAGPQMIRVETDAAVPAPVVHARSVSQSTASQFAELPVNRESSLQTLDPSVLVFPGASRVFGTHSNLILENIGSAGLSGAEVLVEVFDSQGQRLGSGQVSVVGESTFRATTVVDIVGALGVSVLDAGQIRVTKLSGEGVLWGVLSTVVSDGFLKVNVGANP
jgi:hypothetical protein